MRMEYEKVELVMRIISQDGRIDLPYENICLYIDSTLVIASCDNAKHMEMCRKHYAAAEYNRRIITKADTVADMEIAGKLLTSGFIFQFPK